MTYKFIAKWTEDTRLNVRFIHTVMIFLLSIIAYIVTQKHFIQVLLQVPLWFHALMAASLTKTVTLRKVKYQLVMFVFSQVAQG